MSKFLLAVSYSVPTLCRLMSLPKVVDNMVYEVQCIFSITQCFNQFQLNAGNVRDLR